VTAVSARQADITTLAVDAVVNAANESLLGGGGVDGAIHRAAGHELLAHCRGLGGCPTGEARLTPGFRLPARHVIHTVGPIWAGGTRNEPELLARCYQACFRLARDHDLRSLAFPAISCGAYGYPPRAAAAIALDCTRSALADADAFDEIIFACFDDAMRALYDELLALRRVTAP